MANEDKKSVLGWPKRMAQSIFYGAVDAIADTMPVLSATIASNREAAQKLYKDTLSTRQPLAKLKQIQDTYIFKPANQLMKNLKSDIKSGVFYHPEREASAQAQMEENMMKEMLGDAGLEDMMGLLTGEEDLNEAEIADMPIKPVTEVTSGDAFVAGTIAKEQRYATNAIAKINSDIADAHLKVTRTLGNLQLQILQKQTGLLETAVSNITGGFNNISEFANNVIMQHIENSTQYYQSMTELTQQNNAILKEIVEMKRNQYKAKADDPLEQEAPDKSKLFKNGVFDLGQYTKLVSSQINEGFMMVNMLLAGVQGMIAAAVANPLQFATKNIFKSLLGPGLRTAMAKFDESITGFLATTLAKLGDFSKDPKNGILGTIAGLFGLNVENTDIRKTKITGIKEPRSWDGEDHFYLTRVIPSFLSNIEASLTGNDARVFDANSGKFSTIKAMKQRLDRSDQRMADANTGDLKQVMREVLFSTLNFKEGDTKSLTDINRALDQFVLGMQRKGGLHGQEQIEAVRDDKDFGENDNLRQIIYQAFLTANEINPHLLGAVNGRIIPSEVMKNKRRAKGDISQLDESEIIAATNMGMQYRNNKGINIGDVKFNPLGPSFDDSATNSLLEWQAKIHKVLTEIRDFGGQGGNIISSLVGTVKSIIPFVHNDTVGEKAAKADAKRRKKAKKKAAEKDRKKVYDTNLRDATGEANGATSRDSRDINVSDRPLDDPLRIVLEYDTYDDFLNSATYAAMSENYDPSAFNYLEGLFKVKKENKIDNIDGFYAYDQRMLYKTYREFGKDANIQATHYDTNQLTDETAGKRRTNEIVDKMSSTRKNADKMSALSAKLKEGEAFRYNQHNMLDSILGSDVTVEEANYKINEILQSPNASDLSVFQQLANAATLGDKMGILSANISKLAAAPRSMLISVLNTADKMMYEFMFGKPTGDREADGSIVHGLFGKMTSKMESAGRELNLGISKILDKIGFTKDDWFNKVNDKIESWFRFNPRKMGESLKEQGLQFFNPFYENATKGSKSFFSDIGGSISETFRDISDLLTYGRTRPKGRAKGTSYVGDNRGEMALVSKGEAIIYPRYNPFNKNRDSMPDYGSFGTPNIAKTGLTYLPTGSAVIPSNQNPWNPNRSTANPLQDALNENRVQEKIDSALAHYAEGSNVTGDTESKSLGETAKDVGKDVIVDSVQPVLQFVLDKMKEGEKDGLIESLFKTLKIDKGEITSLLGQVSGAKAKEFLEFLDLSDENKEFAEELFKKLWASKVVLDNPELKDFLANFAQTLGIKKLKDEDEILYERYNQKEGIFNGIEQFFAQLTGKNPGRALAETRRYIIHNTPEMMKGGLAGALAGTLFPLGGPLIGAMGGVAVSLLSKNKSFMNYLFGTEIVDAKTGEVVGRHDNGLIPIKFVKALEKYIPDAKKYGITGSLLGLVTPFGPLGGLMAGVAASFIKNNDTANRILFGVEGDEHSGIFSKNLRTKIKKAIPSIATATLGTLFLGPFGFMGNAALGTAIGLISTTETFKKIMLGAKDKNGIRHGGLAGAIKRHITNPLKRNAKKWMEDIGKWFKNDLFKPLSRTFLPVGKLLFNTMKDGVSWLFSSIHEAIAGPGSPFEKLFDYFFGTIKRSGGLGKWLVKNVIGRPIGFAAHFLEDKVGNWARKKNYRRGDSGDETAAEVVDQLRKMKSTNGATNLMYEKVAEMSAKNPTLLKPDANLAATLNMAFGHEGKLAILERQSKAYDNLISNISETTQSMQSAENIHSTLVGFAEELSEAKSSAKVDRILSELRDELKHKKITGDERATIMKMFYDNAKEIRMAKAAEEMKAEGLHTYTDAINTIKETYGFKDINNDYFIEEILPSLSKILTNELRLKGKFKEESAAEQKELGLVPNEGPKSETPEQQATRIYHENMLSGVYAITKFLGSMVGAGPGTIDMLFSASGAGGHNFNRDKALFKKMDMDVQKYIDVNKRQDLQETLEETNELNKKGAAINLDKTVSNMNMDSLRQITAHNNRKYSATLIKLGKAYDLGNRAIVEDFEKIFKLDSRKDGKLFERIGKLTIAGLTVPPEEYENINDLSDVGFNAALQLVALGVTVGSFDMFRRFSDDDQYEADLMIEIAKSKLKHKDEDGNVVEDYGANFLTSEVLSRITSSKEGIVARSFGSHQDFIQDELINHYDLYSRKYIPQKHEKGREMRANNPLSMQQIQDTINGVDEQGSEVSDFTGHMGGKLGVAQSIAEWTAHKGKKAAKAIGKTAVKIADKYTLGIPSTIIDFWTGFNRGRKDDQFVEDTIKAQTYDLVTKQGFKYAKKLEDLVGKYVYEITQDMILHTDHIELYNILLKRLMDGKISPKHLPAFIEKIKRGYNPFDEDEFDSNVLPEDEVVEAPDGSKPPTPSAIPGLAFGSRFIGKPKFHQYSLGAALSSAFSTLGKYGVGFAMGGGFNNNEDKKKDNEEEEQSATEQKSSSKLIRVLDAFTATTATLIGDKINNETTPTPTAMSDINLGEDGKQIINTQYGPVEYERSSADGEIMKSHNKMNAEAEAKEEEDTKRKEETKNVLIEIKDAIKDGLGGVATAGKKKAKGVLDLLKSVTSLPGDIMSSLGAALFAIPIIGPIIKGLLSPIAGLFGKFKNFLFGPGKAAASTAAKGAGGVAARGATAVGGLLMTAVPWPIKLLLAGLVGLFGYSLYDSFSSSSSSSSGSWALTDPITGKPMDPNTGEVITDPNYMPPTEMTPSSLINPMTVAAGGGALLTASYASKLYQQKQALAARSARAQKLLERVQGKAGKEKTAQMLERSIAQSGKNIAKADMMSLMTKGAKFLEPVKSLASKHPMTAALLMAGLSGAAYLGKDVYDDSIYGIQNGSLRKDVTTQMGLSTTFGANDYNPYINGFENGLTPDWQRKANFRKKNGMTDDQITQLLREYEARGMQVQNVGIVTRNDQKFQNAKTTAKDTGSLVVDKAKNLPMSLLRSNLYDYSIAALTGTKLGTMSHSIVAGTAKTIGDVMSGRSELGLGTVADLGTNIGFTYGTNAFVNSLIDKSNNAVAYENNNLNKFVFSQQNNKAFQDTYDSIAKKYNTQIEALKAKGGTVNSLKIKYLERERNLALRQFAKTEAIKAGKLPAPTTMGKVAKYALKPFSIPRQMLLESGTKGKIAAGVTAASLIALEGQKFFASDEEKKRMAIEEKQQKEMKERVEREARNLPRLYPGQKIEQAPDGNYYIVNADGSVFKALTPDQAELYKLKSQLGDGGIFDSAVSKWESTIPGTIFNRGALGHLIANNTLFRNNRLIGGTFGRTAMDFVTGKEITADRLKDNAFDAALWETGSKVFNWIGRRKNEGFVNAMTKDLSSYTTWDWHKRNFSNMRDLVTLKEPRALYDKVLGYKSQYDSVREALKSEKPLEITQIQELAQERKGILDNIEKLKQQGFTEEQIKAKYNYYQTLEKIDGKLKANGIDFDADNKKKAEEAAKKSKSTASTTEPTKASTPSQQIGQQVQEATKTAEAKVQANATPTTPPSSTTAHTVDINALNKANSQLRDTILEHKTEIENIKYKARTEGRSLTESEKAEIDSRNKQIQEASEKIKSNNTIIQNEQAKAATKPTTAPKAAEPPSTKQATVLTPEQEASKINADRVKAIQDKQANIKATQAMKAEAEALQKQLENEKRVKAIQNQQANIRGTQALRAEAAALKEQMGEPKGFKDYFKNKAQSFQKSLRSVKGRNLTQMAAMTAGMMIAPEIFKDPNLSLEKLQEKRELAPGLQIVKGEDGNPVVVDANGTPLQDQSAVEKEPPIPPGTKIIYDETGKRILIDENTGKPAEDQTPVQPRETSLSEKAFTTGLVTRSVLGFTNIFDKTRGLNKALEKGANKVAGAMLGVSEHSKPFLGIANKAMTVSKTAFKLVNTPDSKLLQKVGTAQEAVSKANAAKAARDAAKAAETGGSVVKKGAEEAAEKAGRIQTIINSCKNNLEKLYSVVSKYCPKGMMSAVRSFGEKLLQLMVKPQFMQKLLAMVARQTAGLAAGAATMGIGTLVLTGVFAVTGFMSGWNSAEEMLEIPAGTATLGMKIFCGLITALTAAPGFLGIFMFILNETGATVKVLTRLGFTEIFGFGEKDLKDLRKENEDSSDKEYKSFDEAAKAFSSENIIDWTKKSARGVISAVIGSASSMASAVANQASKAMEGISNLAGAAKDYIMKRSSVIGSKIVEGVKSRASWLKEKAAAGWQTAKEFGSKAVDIGKDLLGKVGNFFTSLVPDPKTLTSNASKQASHQTGKGKYGKGLDEFQQFNPDVSDIPIYGSGDTQKWSYKDRGCGLGALGMLVEAETGMHMNPRDLVNKSKGLWGADDGIGPDALSQVANSYGIRTTISKAGMGKYGHGFDNRVIQLNPDYMSDKSRALLGLTDGPHYVMASTDEASGKTIYLDPSDETGHTIPRLLPKDAEDSATNEIRLSGFGKGKKKRFGRNKDDKGPSRTEVLADTSKIIASTFGHGRYGKGEDPITDVASISSVNLNGENDPIDPKAPSRLPYFKSWDPRWAGKTYPPGGNVQNTGCGPTALAMIASWATGKTHFPDAVAESIGNAGYHQGGTSQAAFPWYAKQKGFDMVLAKDWSEAESALDKHVPIISAQTAGTFTKSPLGHFIVVAGKRGDNDYIVYDPNQHYAKDKFTKDDITSTAEETWIPTGNINADTPSNNSSDPSSTAGSSTPNASSGSSSGWLSPIQAAKKIDQLIEIVQGKRTSVDTNLETGSGSTTTPTTPSTPSSNDKDTADKGKGKVINKADINELQRLYSDIDWSKQSSDNKPDFDKDDIDIIRNKMNKASSLDKRRYLGGPPFRYGKGNTMSVEAQVGGTCTIHATKNILRAYTGKEPEFDANDTSNFANWYGWMINGVLKPEEKGFSKDQRTEFEEAVSSHFAAKPNNPIFLYQTGGDGAVVTNANSGNHATVIGRKLSDGRYEDYDSAGGVVHTLQLKEIFDPTAKGSAAQNTKPSEGNLLLIPTIDPSSPIDHWQGSGTSASPSSTNPTNNTNNNNNNNSPSTPSNPISLKSKGFMGILDSLLQSINVYNLASSFLQGPGKTASSDKNSTPGTSTPGGASGDRMTEEQIWDWFRSKGYSAEATAGIMGRLKCETSNYNPAYEKFQNVDGYESGGMGIFQWTWDTGEGYLYPDLEEGRKKFPDSRLAMYLKWCDDRKLNPESTANQLNYFWEFDKDRKGKDSRADFNPDNMNKMTYAEAARYWTDKFEVGLSTNEVTEAANLYNQYKDRPAPSGKGKFGRWKDYSGTMYSWQKVGGSQNHKDGTPGTPEYYNKQGQKAVERYKSKPRQTYHTGNNYKPMPNPFSPILSAAAVQAPSGNTSLNRVEGQIARTTSELEEHRRRYQERINRIKRNNEIVSSLPFGPVAVSAAKLLGSKHPELFWAQMMNETGGPDYIREHGLEWVYDAHNYGGVKWIPEMGEDHRSEYRPPAEEDPGQTKYYAKFKDDDEYAKMWYKTVLRHYPGLDKATNPDEYALALHPNDGSGNYSQKSAEEYAAGMRGLLSDPRYVDKISQLGKGKFGRRGFWSNLWNGVKTIGKTIWDGIRKPFTNLFRSPQRNVPTPTTSFDPFKTTPPYIKDKVTIKPKQVDKNEELTDIQAPNGKYVTKNDLLYLQNLGYDMEACKNILFADDKYKKHTQQTPISPIPTPTPKQTTLKPIKYNSYLDSLPDWFRHKVLHPTPTVGYGKAADKEEKLTRTIFDQISQKYGPVVASVLLGNINEFQMTTVKAGSGYYNWPGDIQNSYLEYIRKRHADDTPVTQTEYLVYLINHKYVKAIEVMKKQNIETALAIWLKVFENSYTDTPPPQRIKMARKVYEKYYVGAAQSTAEMNKRASEAKLATKEGIDKLALKEAVTSTENFVDPTTTNTEEAQAVNESKKNGGQMGLLNEAIMNTHGQYIGVVSQKLAKMFASVNSAIVSSPLGAMFKKVWGDNAFSWLPGSGATSLFSGASSTTPSTSTSASDVPNPTPTTGTDPNAQVTDAPVEGSAGQAILKMLNVGEEVITSPYGPRNGRIHAGVDYGFAEGTPIPSTVDGVVDGVGSQGAEGYGNYVVVKDKKNYYHIYAHLSDNSKVKEGQTIVAGTIVGLSGNTGSSFGAHLHYGIYDSSNPNCASSPGSVDPMSYPISGLVSKPPEQGKGKYGKGNKIKIRPTGLTNGTDFIPGFGKSNYRVTTPHHNNPIHTPYEKNKTKRVFYNAKKSSHTPSNIKRFTLANSSNKTQSYRWSNRSNIKPTAYQPYQYQNYTNTSYTYGVRRGKGKEENINTNKSIISSIGSSLYNISKPMPIKQTIEPKYPDLRKQIYGRSKQKYGRFAPLAAAVVIPGILVNILRQLVIHIIKNPKLTVSLLINIVRKYRLIKHIIKAGEAGITVYGWWCKAKAIYDVITDQPEDIPEDLEPIQYEALLWLAHKLGFDVKPLEDFIHKESPKHFRMVYNALTGRDYSEVLFEEKVIIEDPDQETVLAEVQQLENNEQYVTDRNLDMKPKKQTVQRSRPKPYNPSYKFDASKLKAKIYDIPKNPYDDEYMRRQSEKLNIKPKTHYVDTPFAKGKFGRVSYTIPPNIKADLNNMKFMDPIKVSNDVSSKANSFWSSVANENLKGYGKGKLSFAMNDIDKADFNRLKKIIDEIDWSNVEEYNKPNIEKDSISILRSKVKTYYNNHIKDKENLNSKLTDTMNFASEIAKYTKDKPLFDMLKTNDVRTNTSPLSFTDKMVKDITDINNYMKNKSMFDMLKPKDKNKDTNIKTGIDENKVVDAISNKIKEVQSLLVIFTTCKKSKIEDPHKPAEKTTEDKLMDAIKIRMKNSNNAGILPAWADPNKLGYNKDTLKDISDISNLYTKNTNKNNILTAASEIANYTKDKPLFDMLKPENTTPKIDNKPVNLPVKNIVSTQQHKHTDIFGSFFKPILGTVFNALPLPPFVKNIVSSLFAQPKLKTEDIDRTTREKVIQAKDKTKKLNQDIETSINISNTPTDHNEEPTKVNAPTNTPLQPIQNTMISDKPNEEQLTTLIAEQRKTNDILLKLLSAIIDSGKSVEDAVKNVSFNNNNNQPDSRENTYNTARNFSRGSSFGAGPVNNNNPNRNNIIAALGAFTNPNR